MARLADIDAEIRVLLKVFAVIGGLALLVFVGVRGWVIAKEVFFPPPPEVPNEKFGTLPALPPNPNPTKLDYVINTVNGALPTFSDRITTYKIKQGTPNLVALSNTRDRLTILGYNQNESKIGESTYQWSNIFGSNIQYNLLTNNFKINSNFLTDPPPAVLNGNAATPKGAYNAAINFLQALEEDISDINPENFKTSYLKIQDGQLIPAESQADAQFIKVDLFQKNINERYQIYYPELNSSTMSFIFRSEDNDATVVQSNFEHYVIDTEESATYPLKSATTAFDQLSKGEAFVLSQNPNSVIDITEVTIGYFLGEEDQKYAIPVIVFLGKDFAGYVQAVR